MVILRNAGHQLPNAKNGPERCLYGKSPNAYMDEHLFLQQFQKIFITSTAHISPVVLILDGHGSNITSRITDGLKLLSITGKYSAINKRITPFFKAAFNETMAPATIKNEFRKCGIYPFKPDAIDKSCLMPTVPLNEV